MSKAENIGEIDALRGLAALGVAAVYHVGHATWVWRTGPLDGLPGFTWLHDNGWALVDLFFVISGFIFSHVYLNEAGKLREGVTARKFFVARFARLYPLHLAMLIFATLVILTLPTPGYLRRDGWHFFLNLTMLQMSGLNDRMSFNGPAWSISVEVFCYALFFVFAVMGRLRIAALILIPLCFAGYYLEDYEVHHMARGPLGFFVGYLVWLWRDKLSRIPTLAVLTFALAALTLPPAIGVPRGNFYSVALWPAIVLLGLRSPWLATAPFRWLGERSYSIYLIHVPLFMALQPLGLGAMFAVVVLLAVSDISFRYFETPWRKRINAMQRMAGPAIATSPPL